MPKLSTSDKGRTFIEAHEGLKLTSYFDSGGVWTIGHGHIGSDVHEGLTISQEEADRLLAADLRSTEDSINKMVKVEINQNQFDALVSFAFNVGVNALLHSTLLKALNEGQYISAAAQFLRWDKVNGRIIKGLMNRRIDERDLFLTPEVS